MSLSSKTKNVQKLACGLLKLKGLGECGKKKVKNTLSSSNALGFQS